MSKNLSQVDITNTPSLVIFFTVTRCPVFDVLLLTDFGSGPAPSLPIPQLCELVGKPGVLSSGAGGRGRVKPREALAPCGNAHPGPTS